MLLKKDATEEAIIKRGGRRREEEEHGSAWKVAFADFCLALMCLFLVLWVLAARNAERAEEAMHAAQMLSDGRDRMLDMGGGARGSLLGREASPPIVPPRTAATGESSNSASNNLANLEKKTYESVGDLKQISQVMERLSDQEGLSGNLHAVVTPFGLRVMLHDTDKQGMFERGSAIPSAQFRTLLRKIGPLFSQVQNQMLIIGHTDAAQYAKAGSAGPSNWKLSSDRAMAARAQLLEGGMPVNSVLQVVGMADRAPFDPNSRADVNRRIELLILTSAQAQAIAAMFGKPKEVEPLLKGVDTSPASGTLDTLRAQLRAARDALHFSKGDGAAPAPKQSNHAH